MLGLFRNDILVVKKTLIITALTVGMVIAFGVIFCGSLQYGNLAKLPPEDYESTFYAATTIFGPFGTILLSIMQPFILTNYINRQSGWYRFIYTTSISESRVALVSLLERVGFSVFCLIIGLISTLCCYGIAGREVTADDILIILVGLLLTMFLSLLPTSYIMKTKDGETFFNLVIIFAAASAAFVGALCYANGNLLRIEKLLNVLSEKMGLICLIIAAADIAVFFISWATATHILKKRKF